MRKSQLTSDEKNLCTEFLYHITDNKKFNKRFNRLIRKKTLVPFHLKSDSPEAKKHGETNTELSKYSYKTFGLRRIFSSVTKLTNINKKLSKSSTAELPEGEKITLRELGSINKFIDNPNVMEVALAVSKNHSALCNIHNHNNLAQDAYSDFFGRVQDLAQDTYKAGDIMMESSKDLFQYLGRNPKGFEEKLRNFISPYSHASIVTKNDGILEHSRIDTKYERIGMIESEPLISDAFRILPDRLMSKQNNVALSKALNMNENNLETYLEKAYQDIATNMHNNMGDAEIINSPKQIKKVGKSSFIHGGKTSKEKVGRWVDRVGNLANIVGVSTAIAEDADGLMVCSSFAVKTTILALHQLEDKIQEKVKEKGLGDKIPAKGFFRIPVKKKANLDMLNPSNVVSQLKRFGAIKKVNLGLKAIKEG